MGWGQGGHQKPWWVFDVTGKKKPRRGSLWMDLIRAKGSIQQGQEQRMLHSRRCDETTTWTRVWAQKVEFLGLKTLRAGAGKQEDAGWPEEEGKSLPTTWTVSAETRPLRRFSFPSHIVQLPPFTLLPIPAFCYRLDDLDHLRLSCTGPDPGEQGL